MKNNNIWVTLNNKLTKIFSFENQTQLAEFLLKTPSSNIPSIGSLYAYDLKVHQSQKVAYNKVYNKTSRGCLVNLLFLVSFGVLTLSIPSCDFKKSDKAGGSYDKPTVN